MVLSLGVHPSVGSFYCVVRRSARFVSPLVARPAFCSPFVSVFVSAQCASVLVFTVWFCFLRPIFSVGFLHFLFRFAGGAPARCYRFSFCSIVGVFSLRVFIHRLHILSFRAFYSHVLFLAHYFRFVCGVPIGCYRFYLVLLYWCFASRYSPCAYPFRAFIFSHSHVLFFSSLFSFCLRRSH